MSRQQRTREKDIKVLLEPSEVRAELALHDVWLLPAIERDRETCSIAANE